jgi:glucokinase
VWFSASARSIGAVEILPGRVHAATVSLTGEVRTRATAPFATRTADPAGFAAALRSCCAEALAGTAVIGVGVASAGLVDRDRGLLVELTAAPALAGFPIGETLRAQVDAPVYLEHHVRVQALGDRWFGAGRGLDTFASVSTGDSVGVGVVQRGAVLSAPGAGSGAHLTVAAGGERCDCGRRGCWKTLATVRWLRRRAAALGVAGARGTTLARLAARADHGDRSAAGLIDEYAANLALGLGNVQQLLAPGTFILHGDAATGGSPFADRIAARLTGYSPHRSAPAVLAADPVQDTALLGCAGLVLAEGMQLLS